MIGYTIGLYLPKERSDYLHLTPFIYKKVELATVKLMRALPELNLNNIRREENEFRNEL